MLAQKANNKAKSQPCKTIKKAVGLGFFKVDFLNPDFIAALMRSYTCQSVSCVCVSVNCSLVDLAVKPQQVSLTYFHFQFQIFVFCVRSSNLGWHQKGVWWVKRGVDFFLYWRTPSVELAVLST